MAIVFGSPEAEAILKAEKERVKAEKEKAKRPVYRWVQCNKCEGKGTCPTCKAARNKAGDCNECGGGGDCLYCDGDGEVQMVKTETGWAYVSG